MEESWYDSEADVLNIEIAEGEHWKGIELDNGIILSVTKEGKAVSMEILEASKVFKGDNKNVLTSVKQLVEEEQTQSV